MLLLCTDNSRPYNQNNESYLQIFSALLFVIITYYKNSSGDEIANVNFYAVRP